jgi:hypothetical protein
MGLLVEATTSANSVTCCAETFMPLPVIAFATCAAVMEARTGAAAHGDASAAERTRIDINLYFVITQSRYWANWFSPWSISSAAFTTREFDSYERWARIMFTNSSTMLTFACSSIPC